MSLNPSDHTSPTDDEVLFFTSLNYGGTVYASDANDQVDLSTSYPSLDNKLLSVKLGRNCYLFASENCNLTGPYQYITASDPNLPATIAISSYVVVNRASLPTLSSSEDGFTFVGRCGHRVKVEFPCSGVGIPTPQPLPCHCHRHK